MGADIEPDLMYLYGSKAYHAGDRAPSFLNLVQRTGLSNTSNDVMVWRGQDCPTVQVAIDPLRMELCISRIVLCSSFSFVFQGNIIYLERMKPRSFSCLSYDGMRQDDPNKAVRFMCFVPKPHVAAKAPHSRSRRYLFAPGYHSRLCVLYCAVKIVCPATFLVHSSRSTHNCFKEYRVDNNDFPQNGRYSILVPDQPRILVSRHDQCADYYSPDTPVHRVWAVYAH